MILLLLFKFYSQVPEELTATLDPQLLRLVHASHRLFPDAFSSKTSI